MFSLVTNDSEGENVNQIFWWEDSVPIEKIEEREAFDSCANTTIDVIRHRIVVMEWKAVFLMAFYLLMVNILNSDFKMKTIYGRTALTGHSSVCSSAIILLTLDRVRVQLSE